jgi:uncharacterized protein (TIGR04222 family)
MERPWGLSGPTFLWLYGAGLIVALALAFGVRAQARRPRLTEPPPTLDLEAIAFLAGGTRRVFELAIARLLDSGAVRANRGGTIRAVQGATTADRIGTAVLDALGRRSINVNKLMRSVRVPRQVEQLGDWLAARRLVLTPTEAARTNRRALLGLYLLLAIGAVRLVNGVVDSLPVMYLAGLLAATVVMIVLLTKRRVAARTVHGDRALDGARGAIVEGVDLVALDGLGAFPDRQVRRVLAPVTMSGAGWGYVGSGYAACGGGGSLATGGGSSGDSGGGSSCGGGGCGGGCGGGGG